MQEFDAFASGVEGRRDSASGFREKGLIEC